MSSESKRPSGRAVEFLVVVSRRAGGFKLRNLENIIRDFFVKNSLTFEFYFLDAGTFRLPKTKFQTVLIVGGDGTLRRAVDFFYHQKIKKPIALLPSGSANVFAKIHKIPKNPTKNLQRLLKPKKQKIAVGILNQRDVFLIAAVFGRIARFSLEAEYHFKHHIGFWAYISAGVCSLFHFPHQKLQVNTQHVEAHSVLIFPTAIAQKLAVLKNPRAPLHVFIPRNKTFHGMLKILCALHLFRRRTDLVEIEASQNIILSGKFENQIHLDGDRVQTRGSRFEITVAPQAFTLLT